MSREAVLIGVLVIVGVLLSLGLLTESATGAPTAITPVLGTPVCTGEACADELTLLPSILK